VSAAAPQRRWIEFLSDEWFDRAAACTGEVTLSPSLAATLRYHSTSGGETRSWTQIVADGKVAWSTRPCDRVDVEICWSAEDAFAILSGRRADNRAIAAMTIAELRPDGAYVGPPPPFDLAARPELDDMPLVPGADIDVALEYRTAPFGVIDFRMCFRSGRLAELSPQLLERPDAALALEFRNVMRWQRGELGLLQMLESGEVVGSEGALGLLGGIVESEEYERALRASSAGSAPLALATLGELTHQPEYAAAMRALCEETMPPS
jgi:hypothetical protein